MLILTRRVGEAVMIGSDVTVTVLGVKGNQVRIGVNAPKHVAVHREEIFERIQREHGDAPAEGHRPEGAGSHVSAGQHAGANGVGGSGAAQGPPPVNGRGPREAV